MPDTHTHTQTRECEELRRCIPPDALHVHVYTHIHTHVCMCVREYMCTCILVFTKTIVGTGWVCQVTVGDCNCFGSLTIRRCTPSEVRVCVRAMACVRVSVCVCVTVFECVLCEYVCVRVWL